MKGCAQVIVIAAFLMSALGVLVRVVSKTPQEWSETLAEWGKTMPTLAKAVSLLATTKFLLAAFLVLVGVLVWAQWATLSRWLRSCAVQAAWRLRLRRSQSLSSGIAIHVPPSEDSPPIMRWVVERPAEIEWVTLAFRIADVHGPGDPAEGRLRPGISVMRQDESSYCMRFLITSKGQAILRDHTHGGPEQSHQIATELDASEWHTLHMRRAHPGLLCFVDGVAADSTGIEWPDQVSISIEVFRTADVSGNVYVRGPWFGH